MDTIAKRIKQFAIVKEISLKDIADTIEINEVTFRQSLNRNSIKEEVLDAIVKEYGVMKMWLVTGEGAMFNAEQSMASEPAVDYGNPKNVKVVEPYVMETYENSFGNRFLKLQNGQWIMTLPLADYEVQAGFLDKYQDVEEVGNMDQHSIIVPKTAQGRYVAFRVTGSSMDDGTSDSIRHNDIVSTRELKRELWQYKLKYKEFPYWVIFTKESSTPLIKQIIEHDVDNGVLTCHSLNNLGYNDFEVSMNDVLALFYVVNVTREVTTKDYLGVN